MSRRIVYAPVAVQDLEDVFDYISQDNPEAAAKVAKEIEETVALLPEFPFMGRTLNEAGLSGHRALVIGNYLAFYTVSDKEIQIRRILHGARRYETLLGNEAI